IPKGETSVAHGWSLETDKDFVRNRLGRRKGKSTRRVRGCEIAEMQGSWGLLATATRRKFIGPSVKKFRHRKGFRHEHGHAADFASRGAPKVCNPLQWQWARPPKWQRTQEYDRQLARERSSRREWLERKWRVAQRGQAARICGRREPPPSRSPLPHAHQEWRYRSRHRRGCGVVYKGSRMRRPGFSSKRRSAAVFSIGDANLAGNPRCRNSPPLLQRESVPGLGRDS